MPTLPHLLLWMTLTATVGIVAAFVRVRWAVRRVRDRLTARLNRRLARDPWPGTPGRGAISKRQAEGGCCRRSRRA
jgi:hypothetical protein